MQPLNFMLDSLGSHEILIKQYHEVSVKSVHVSVGIYLFCTTYKLIVLTLAAQPQPLLDALHPISSATASDSNNAILIDPFIIRDY